MFITVEISDVTLTCLFIAPLPQATPPFYIAFAPAVPVSSLADALHMEQLNCLTSCYIP